MSTDKPKNESLTVEERLTSLYKLQTILSEIDRIKQIRGDLPLEVKDIDDQIAGLKTRLSNYHQKIEDNKSAVTKMNALIADCKSKKTRYEEQLENIKNNRQYDSLTKELEYQDLIIEDTEKDIVKLNHDTETVKKEIESTELLLVDKQHILEEKKGELAEIVAETKQEEENLRIEAKQLEPQIDDRTLTAFKRIRQNARNGLGIVTIQRDACGGCYNRIPPQKQLEIKMHKKVIVSEYCCRILIDPSLIEENQEENQ